MSRDELRLAAVRSMATPPLKPLEAKALLALYADRDGPLSIDDILNATGTDSPSSVRVVIANIRQALGSRLIINAHGKGYHLSALGFDRVHKVLRAEP